MMTNQDTTIDSLESLRDRLRRFVLERDWHQYHTPKNLSMALIAEAAELVEHFQWVDGNESHLLEDKTRQAVEEELADILIYLVRISDKLLIIWTGNQASENVRCNINPINLRSQRADMTDNCSSYLARFHHLSFKIVSDVGVFVDESSVVIVWHNERTKQNKTVQLKRNCTVHLH